MSKADELWDYFAKDLRWGAGHQSVLVFDFLREAAQVAAGGVVLDAGAGHQRYKPFFFESLYLGQEHPVAGAANKGITKYEILCDVRTIPLREGSLNVVLSTSSLEHIRHPEEFFREAFRVLAPGGGLFIHVPFIYLEHEIPFDFQRPTRYGLRDWYGDAGFERAIVRPASSAIYTALTCMDWALAEDDARTQSLPSRIGARLLRRSWPLYRASLSRLFDGGPRETTTLPIGWLAVGYKPGQRPPSDRWQSSEAFLRANAALGARFQGDALIYDQ